MRQIEIRTRDDDSGSDETRQWLSVPAAASVVTIDTAGLPVVTPIASVAALGGAVVSTGGTMTGPLSVIVPGASTAAITASAGNTVLTSIVSATAATGVFTPLVLRVNTTGTPAAGLGARIDFQIDTNGAVSQPAARIDALWVDATQATRTSQLTFSCRTTGSPNTALILSNTQAQFNDGLAGLPGICFRSEPTTGIFRNSAGLLTFIGSGLPRIHINTTNVIIGNTNYNSPVGDSLSVLAGAGAGAGGKLSFYNVLTDASNFERVNFQWFSNVLYFAVDKLGSGTYRDMQIWNGATRLMTFSTSKIGFFEAAAVVKQVSAADLTNSVTVGGTTDAIADFADLTTYANSAAAIRNNIYQLARKVKQVNDALRLYGLLT